MNHLNKISKINNCIQDYFLCDVLQFLSISGIAKDLKFGISRNDLQNNTRYNSEILNAVFDFLINTNIIAEKKTGLCLTDYGQTLFEYIGWFNLFVGGYGSILLKLDEVIANKSVKDLRNCKQIAIGSGLIDKYDIIPLLKELILCSEIKPSKILDLGCGSGACLIALCKEYNKLSAIGVEKKKEVVDFAKERISKSKLTSRIKIVKGDASGYQIDYKPDFIILSFVLHEIVGHGEDFKAIETLKNIKHNYPRAKLLVCEVLPGPVNPKLQTSGYYNCYYLLHKLTNQNLRTDQDWKRIFKSSGYDVMCKRKVNHAIDPSGKEIGYLLSPKIF